MDFLISDQIFGLMKAGCTAFILWPSVMQSGVSIELWIRSTEGKLYVSFDPWLWQLLVQNGFPENNVLQ